MREYAEANEYANLTVENFYASLIKSTQGITSTIQVLRTYNNIAKTDIDTRQAYANAVGQTNKELGETLVKLKGADATAGTFIRTITGLTTKTIALKVAQTALNFAINAGVGLLIGSTISAINSYINKQEEVTQKLKDNTSELNENLETIDEYKKKITTLKSNLDSNSLSFAEQKEIRQQLLDIQDEMISKYGKEIKSVDILKDSMEDLLSAYEKLSDEEANKWYTDNKSELDSAIENVNAWGGVDRLTDLSDTIARLQKERFDTIDDLRDFLSNSDVSNAFQNIPGLDIETIESRYNFAVSEILRNEDNTLTEEQASAKVLSDIYSDIVAKASVVYDYATKQGDALKNVPSWMERFGNTMLGNRQGLLDEDIETYKDAGRYLSQIFAPELYKNATSALNDYNDALAEDNTENVRKSAKDITGIYNNLSEAIANVPEQYRGVIHYYYESLFGDIVRENDDIEDKLKFSVREIMDSLQFHHGESVAISFLPNLANMYDNLSKEEIDTLLKIIQGEIDTGGIDWLTSLTPDKVKDRIDTIINATKFNFSDFFSTRTVDGTENTLKDIIDNTVNPLKSAYKTLQEGGTLDSSFFDQFPDLLQYANDADALKQHMQELINTATESSLKELLLMYNSTDDENIKAVLKQAIELLRIDRDITTEVEDTNDAYAKEKELIQANIDKLTETINKINKKIKKQKEAREVLEKEKETLEEQAALYDSAVNAVTRQIDKQIEALERQKAVVEEYYDNQINALKEEAEERDRINELREKELALEKAKNNKVRRYSASRGWVIILPINIVIYYKQVAISVKV